MTAAEIVTLLGAVGSLIGVIGGIIIQLRGQTEARTVVSGLNTKLDTAHESIKAVQDTVADVKDNVALVQVQTNHLTTALVEKTALSSYAEGKAAEKANPT